MGSHKEELNEYAGISWREAHLNKTLKFALS